MATFVKSNVVVGEVTVLNQNVFFELGYADGLEKIVYLFRNIGLRFDKTFLLESGIYVNQYKTGEDIVAHLLSEQAEWLKESWPLFDGG